MVDYYLEGEEKFGPITSLAYWLGVKLTGMNKFYSFILDDIKKSKYTELLDVGTGPGYVPVMLAESGMKNLYAIDPSYDMLKIAKRRSKDLKIRYGIGSSRNVPFKRKFELVISTLSFHHWAKKAESLKYLSRFLKKGGEIRIYEFEREKRKGWTKHFISSHSVSKKEMLDIARKSGLKIRGMVRKGGFIRIAFTR